MNPLGTSVTPEDAFETIQFYADNPRHIYSDIFATNPWDIQIQIMEAVFQYSEVAVASCHGIGKSWTAARVALAFLLTHPGGLVITTAPTWAQVEDIIWRELAAAYEASKISFGGSLTKTKLEIAPDWYAIGRSTKKADNFVGYHADDVLMLVDEASGVEEVIYEGIRGVTSNERAHTLYIGNPTNPSGSFAKAFKNPLVKKFYIACWDTPNFTANNIRSLGDLLKIFTPPEGVDPADHVGAIRKTLTLAYPGLISPRWVYERYLEWGTASPMWQAKVEGRFPDQAEDALIPLHLLEQSADPAYREEHNWQIPGGRLEIGVDVARFGSDRTTIVPRRGGWVDKVQSYSGLNIMQTRDKVLASFDPEEWHTMIKPDDTGLGGGLTDALNEKLDENVLWRYTVSGINFGSASNKPEKFFNLRAEMYWTIREWVLNKKIALPEGDEELINELASIRYSYTPKQQIRIEAKEDYRKRTGKSPDKADGLVLAFARAAVGTFSEIGRPTTEPSPMFEKPITGTLGRRY